MVSVTAHKRREFPAKIKLAAWERCKIDGVPHCERCRMKMVGTPVYDHDLPDAFYGEPTLENCVVSCRKCDRIKTYEQDIPRIAKADRIARKNAGIRRRSSWRKSPPRVRDINEES